MGLWDFKRRSEKYALWGALTVMGAPLGFLPSLLTLWDRLRVRADDSALIEEAHQEGYWRLPPDDSLVRMCRKMAKQAGTHIDGVFIVPKEPICDISVRISDNQKHYILIQGDPRFTDPEQGKFPERALQGAIAHEIGHVLFPDYASYLFKTLATAGCYAGAGILAGVIGIGCLAGGGLAAAGTFFGVAATGVLGTAASFGMLVRFMRNDEYLADLYGAKHFGAERVVECLEHLQHLDAMNRAALPEALKMPEEQTPSLRLFSLTMSFAMLKYPTSQRRIDVLRTAFNLPSATRKNQNAAQCAASPAPHA